MSNETQTLEQNVKRPRSQRIAVVLTVVLIIGVLIGQGLSYLTFSGQINELQQEIRSFQSQTQTSSTSLNTTFVSYVTGDNISVPLLYDYVRDSIVVIQGIISGRTPFGTLYGEVQGSGFVFNLTGRMLIITNFHVVDEASDITVTFTNGNAFSATILGSDPHADLAVLSVVAPSSEFHPLQIVDSNNLKVGDPVMAIGNPFGLEGSITTGIVSQIGRTITEETTGTYAIADVIQISAAINSGNSGGPLLNYLGQVIGITTATVSGSQGIGFAIPSSTILREISDLVNLGTYTSHSWLGVSGTSMDYYVAEAIDVDVTYGWLIQSITSGSPADSAGLRAGNQRAQIVGNTVTLGGDIIIAIDGVRIANGDDAFAYLERYTSPGQTINITIIRNNQSMDIFVTLSAKPSSST